MPNVKPLTDDFTQIYYRQVDTVYRICYSFMKNASDTEDMVQDTFLRLLDHGKTFENERHEKAWLIVTASNLCKDDLKKRHRRNIFFEEEPAQCHIPEHSEVLEAVLNLKPEYKTPVYMYYFEGYSTQEIAAFLRCPHATVRSRLSRARKQLRLLLKE